MTEPIVISIDAMGGDDAPTMVIDGLKQVYRTLRGVSYLVYGDEAQIRPLLETDQVLMSLCEIRHADEVVGNNQKAAQAVRQGRNTSMWQAIQAVKSGEAHGVVSAGNTGALMGMALIQLRTLPTIDRPAIATILPSMKQDVVVLDLGANAECDAKNLVDFAIMGEVFSRTVLNYETPSVGILNIGSEDQKGHEGVRAAADILRSSDHLHLKFHGFVEGDDIAKGTVDVVVTDGFTGNVLLKTAEGTAKFYSNLLKGAFRSSILSRLGYLLASGALNTVKKRTDPRRYNGAMFLGLRGICVKSHGGTDAFGFGNAVRVATGLVANGFNDRIMEELEQLALDAPPVTIPESAASTTDGAVAVN